MQLNRKKTVSMIGLAMKAGKVASGEFAVERAVKMGGARLVLVAEDASNPTKKKFHDMCSFYKVPCLEAFGKEELGHIIGKEYRACAAVTDGNFAAVIEKHPAGSEN